MRLVLSALCFVASLSFAAEGTSERRYALADRGHLTLRVPALWKDNVRQPPGSLPPTITFGAGQGRSFEVLITPIWRARPHVPVPTRDSIRQAVERGLAGIRFQAVEKEIPIVAFEGSSGPGYYFSAPDKAPKPGEYKNMTQGMMIIGELVVSFTVLTNDRQGEIVRDAISMLRSATAIVTGPPPTPLHVPRANRSTNPGDWATWGDAVQGVMDLYSADEFAPLERVLAQIATSSKQFVNGESQASAAYWAFRRLMPAPGMNPAHLEILARWRKAVPGSSFVHFAQARAAYGTAWNVRGSVPRGEVTAEMARAFEMHLTIAEQMLLDAPGNLRDTPLWHNLRLAIAHDKANAREQADAVFEQAVKRWPRYFDFYEVRLTRLVPYWGGSWQEVESFIDHWSRQRASTEGSSLYARLYLSLRNEGVALDATAMDWTRMKASLDDLTNRYPSPHFKNLYATYACLARDKAAFGTALRKLSKSELNRKDWLSRPSYDECMKWATV